ncbi:mitochondrial inner membrane protease ATP23 homolog [Saccoglossus kowalevskii]|uniref:Mitochondrial inner membrane protease ATP23 n=1 Tax=Saccoglossus kowalevskii TaxID=10224 RepID=A0ABM0GYL3_SACKO|nr:PREDICTED: mitochondrial inner membrane protease ATP23 homolog [Saccoglossus kowalevskii]
MAASSKRHAATSQSGNYADADAGSVPFGEGDFILKNDSDKSTDSFTNRNINVDVQVDKSNYGKLLGHLGSNHYRCLGMAAYSRNNPYVKLLLQAMSQSGCEAFQDRHFACEQCSEVVNGGFDPSTSQIVLCQNNIKTQSAMDRVITHELIHAFDHCRAKINWNDIRHLACTEIRAANLSGDCSFGMEHFGRFHRMQFGFVKHQQTCVKDRAIRSVLAVRDTSEKLVKQAVDEVFDTCFNDLEPFHKIPRSKSDAKAAWRERYRYEL